MLSLLVVVTIGYFLGAIPFGVIISKKFRGFDLRAKGSGNMGSTNAFRTLAAVHVALPCGRRMPLWFRSAAISSSDLPFSSVRLILIRQPWSSRLQSRCESRTFQGSRCPPSALRFG